MFQYIATKCSFLSKKKQCVLSIENTQYLKKLPFKQKIRLFHYVMMKHILLYYNIIFFSKENLDSLLVPIILHQLNQFVINKNHLSHQKIIGASCLKNREVIIAINFFLPRLALQLRIPIDSFLLRTRGY